MYSEVSIVNVGLTLIGEPRIVSLSDDTKQAREANAIWEHTRDALLAAHNWNFARTRVQLPADVDAPLFDYAKRYTLPVDCLRVVRVGDHYVGADLTDYRGYAVEEYAIENGGILTNMSAPLNVIYIKKTLDYRAYAPVFAMALGAKMGENLCEPLNQSAAKKDRAIVAFRDAMKEAIRSNAIELPPTKLADDEWVLSRL